MKKSEIKAAALALCGVLSLCGCSQKSSGDSSTGTSSTVSSIDISSENSSSSSVFSESSVSTASSSESVSSSESSSTSSSSTTASSASSTTTDKPVEPTTSAVQSTESEPSLEWTESYYSAVMYVNTDCYSRVKPILGFTKAGLYHVNDKVNVVAKTNTDYFKLDNGEFISVDYLSTSKVTVQSSSSTTSTISSSSSSSSRHSDIVYIDIGSSIGRPLSDYFN